jgi:hypothetical protein
MTRPCSAFALAACLLALAGCGGSHAKSVTSGEHAAASLFAAAYARFLDGADTASGLPDATAGARALASRGGSIPAARRRGTLLMTQLRPAAGATGGYLLTARDDAHTFYLPITLAEQHGHWLVVALTPPDFVQVLAPAGPPPPAGPHGSTAPERASRLFLSGYLPWLYGQAPLRTITAATNELLANLKAHPPRVPPTMQSLRPKVAAIAMQRRDGRDWQALPNINDGHETYELVLTVAHTRGRWLVNNVSSPR